MSGKSNLAATLLASTLSLAALGGATTLLGRPTVQAHTVSNPSPTPVKLSSNFATVADPVQPVAPAMPIEQTSEISSTDFLNTATDAEIDAVEKENGFSFTNTIQVEEEPEMEEFSGSFELGSESKSTITKPKKTAKSRWFDGMDKEDAYQLAEKTIGIPTSLQRKIIYIESKGNQFATNVDSGACGLKQLMPESTLPEMAYKYSKTLGFDDLQDSVMRYTIGKDSHGRTIVGYRPVTGERNHLRQECYNVWINVSLGAMNLAEKMRRIDNMMLSQQGHTIRYVQTDLYIAHFLGARPDIVLAARNNPNALAKDFVNSRVRSQNYSMFYDSNKKPRTVAQMYAHIDNNGHGPSAYTYVDPFWRTSAPSIQQNIQLAAAP